MAAADGVVIKAQETYVQGVGYGRYLIIDHGGNISTLYGHTSQLLVSEGDHVTRGQAIAKVGSTGWSTGPHLHFEVREAVPLSIRSAAISSLITQNSMFRQAAAFPVGGGSLFFMGKSRVFTEFLPSGHRFCPQGCGNCVILYR